MNDKDIDSSITKHETITKEADDIKVSYSSKEHEESKDKHLQDRIVGTISTEADNIKVSYSSKEHEESKDKHLQDIIVGTVSTEADKCNTCAWCHMWSRNGLPFRSTRVHPLALEEFMLF